jgi:hypothetical protein
MPHAYVTDVLPLQMTCFNLCCFPCKELSDFWQLLISECIVAVLVALTPSCPFSFFAVGSLLGRTKQVDSNFTVIKFCGT